jgi:DNA-binding transcriptional MerR regulator
MECRGRHAMELHFACRAANKMQGVARMGENRLEDPIEKKENDTSSIQIHQRKDVADKLGVAETTIRNYEKELEGIIVIKRDHNNARYYTDTEIATFKTVKEMRDKGIGFKMIRELLAKAKEVGHKEETGITSVVPAPIFTQTEANERMLGMQEELQKAILVIQELVEENRLMSSQMIEMKKELAEIKSHQLMIAAASEASTQLQELKNEILQVQESVKSIDHSEKFEALEKQIKDVQQNPSEERQRNITNYITQKRVESQLKKEALAAWEEKSESERIKKVGWFKKVEDQDKKNRFIEDFINDRLEKRIKEAYDIQE